MTQLARLRLSESRSEKEGVNTDLTRNMKSTNNNVYSRNHQLYRNGGRQNVR
jgi:hypothetical protein